MDPTAEKAFEQGAEFLKMWSQLMTNAGQAGISFNPGDAPPDAFKQVRGAILESMGKSFETYMRSPEFLEGMKQQMDAAIAFRKQMNSWLTTTAHETQRPAREDVENIDRRLRDIESDLGERVDAVEEKLDTIISLLSSSSNGSSRTSRTAKKTTKKTTRKAAKKAKK